MPKLATAIGAAIGRSVTFVDVPPEVFSAALLSAGLRANCARSSWPIRIVQH